MRCRFHIFSWLSLAAGCAGVTTVDGDRLKLRSPEFRSYAEAVFRQQNQALDALALSIDASGVDARELEELEAAEANLLAACAGLNEVAARRRDQLDSGLGTRWRAARTTPECELALRVARAALKERGR